MINNLLAQNNGDHPSHSVVVVGDYFSTATRYYVQTYCIHMIILSDWRILNNFFFGLVYEFVPIRYVQLSTWEK